MSMKRKIYKNSWKKTKIYMKIKLNRILFNYYNNMQLKIIMELLITLKIILIIILVIKMNILLFKIYLIEIVFN